MNLTDARQGQHVVYVSPGDHHTEPGVVTSVGVRWVFVRYGIDTHGKATDPAALHLAIR